jgi:O-antigen/teichoic acid export membrane protein
MLCGQGLGYGLKAIYFIVIARLLGVLDYGIFVGAFALVYLAAQYSRVGMGTVLLRYVSANQSRFSTYWGNVLIVTTVVGSILILLLRAIGPHILDPTSAGIIFLTAVGCCFCEQITISATQVFQARQQMQVAAFLNQLTSMLRTLAAVGMLLVWHHATARQWALAAALASAAAMAIAVVVVTARVGWPHFAPALMWKHSGEGMEYAFASSTTNAYNDLDKAMLSHFGMIAANGIYGVAYRIIDMATVPLAAIQLAAEPRLFQLADTGVREAMVVGRRLLRHSIAIGIVTAFGICWCAPLIPFLAGRGFEESISALRWLCLMPIFRSVHGITGSVLTCIGMQRYRTVTQIMVVLLNFSLNLWLIPRYGWRGAAWASLATDGVLAILNWSILERLTGTMGGSFALMVQSEVRR